VDAKFDLPPLPYAPTDLEPYISERTIEFHYGKHHRAYVENLNKLIAGTDFEGKSLEEIIKASHHKSPAVFNNAAQVWNHTFFWNSLKKNGGGEPKGKLRQKLEEAFGSMELFEEDILAAGKTLFGSGWVWLVANEDGDLEIEKTSNAENPLVFPRPCFPLLTIDVWEHAYYLDYQNRKPAFVDMVYDNLLNWEFAAANYEKATALLKTA